MNIQCVSNNSRNNRGVSFNAIIRNDIPKKVAKNKNFLCIVSGPSGAGKDSVIGGFNKNTNFFKKVVTCTTRSPRPGEVNGIDYHFLTPEEFRKGIENGDFVEFEEVYKDRFYGTRKKDVDSILESGKNALLIVDVNGAQNIMKKVKDAISLFIKPTSLEALRNQLTNRGTETVEEIEKRLSRAGYELSFEPKYDAVLRNDNLNESINEVGQIFNAKA